MPPKEATIGYWIGWCVLAAAITQAPLVLLGAIGAGNSSQVGLALLLTVLPSFLMLLFGGFGLIRRQFYGYWCTYLAAFFGGIGGLRISFVPFIQRWLNLGPHTGDLFLALNLIIIAVLAWEHFLRLSELELPRQRIHRVVMACILLLGLGSVAFGRAMESHARGEVQTAAEIPVAGRALASLKSNGPVHFVSVRTKLADGLDLVFSGKSSEEAIRGLAQALNLKLLEKPEAYAKILPRTRKWNLDQNKFPTQFAPPDLIFIGRIDGNGRAILQLAWRQSDSRFTGELIGTIPD